MSELILKDVVIRTVDNRGKNPPLSQTGVPIVETASISGSSKYPDYSRVSKYVSEEVYNTWFRSGHPSMNFLIFVTVGNGIGSVGLMDKKKAVIAQNLVAFQIKASHDPSFLYYYFIEASSQHYLKGLDIGSAQPSIKVSHLLNSAVPSIPLPEQQAIAEVLSSLDEKIDLLHRNNKTLEEMAETLLKGACINSKTILLGDIIEIHDNKRIPLSSIERAQKKEGKLYPYYGAATIMDYVNEFIFDGDYILLGEDGTVQTEEGFPVLQRLIGKAWVNNHTHVINAKAPYNNDILEMTLKNTSVSHIVTGAVQPKINQGSLKNLEIIVPNDDIEVLCASISTLMNKRESNNRQIGSLKITRDTLLPKLMSGQIKVNI